MSFNHLSISVLGHHNRAINQHTEPQQHAEHDHEVEGITQRVDEDQREKERDRNTDADDDTAAKSHGRDNHNHHETKCGKDIAL